MDYFCVTVADCISFEAPNVSSLDFAISWKIFSASILDLLPSLTLASIVSIAFPAAAVSF
jgi:hypothetical protein